MRHGIHRRDWLLLTAASGWCGLTSRTCAGEGLPIKDPRATDGDSVSQPNWEQQLTITVGPRNADLMGDVELHANTFRGFEQEIVDDRVS